MQKLILGTAQFGNIPYGIKGDGLVTEQEIEKIAQVAWDGGIRIIHTSWQYGLPKISEAIFSEFEWIRKYKDAKNLFRHDNRTGFCLYDPDDMLHLVNGNLIQIPINILDKRFLNLIKDGIIVHARSVFLQGLLLMKKLPPWIPVQVRAVIHDFKSKCYVMRLQEYEAALGWVLGLKEVDHVIVGVNSVEQLKQLLDVEPLQWEYNFSIQDENVLDPRRWPPNA